MKQLTGENFTRREEGEELFLLRMKQISSIPYPEIYDESVPQAKKTNAGANSRGCAGRLIG